ncbi:segregation and condensation protein A [Denitratisoma oestradiolicum]|uniref:Segregation and condensation protein A n=1 Tax=Denitratisoma oestradiolicum TaxID=311182 RepID=A0A6S6Y0I3_9PROT|nr:ScpA family protein [Denitratisoma oestradiolicum]TWO81474.1 segregation/condensation protein A [Denitratisoma oestradiolicum]CAB1368682.1 Segregation and condensation protein A [Denitratisoma oestradiolicum]
MDEVASIEELAPLVAHPVKVYGELMAEMPRDLYIPPDALEVILESFEGPLDLLLYLIRKANVNVLDIPMAPLTAQYLKYVDAMQKRRNLELAAEYLLMAAMLIEIKSRMLLPRPPKAETGEAEDPRAELVRRLLEYEQMKMAAAKIDALPQAGRNYEWVTVWIADKVVERQPEVSLHDLQLAWLGLMKQAHVTQHHKIHREELSVREFMTAILRRLQGRGFVVFEDLFDVALGRQALVVSFLAILELARESLVDITQAEALAPIYVRVPDAPTLQA